MKFVYPNCFGQQRRVGSVGRCTHAGTGTQSKIFRHAICVGQAKNLDRDAALDPDLGRLTR